MSKKLLGIFYLIGDLTLEIVPFIIYNYKNEN